MTDKERLEYIKKQLKAIVRQLNPISNQLFILNECLKDLINVSDYKKPEHV